MSSTSPWVEKYRPQNLSEVVQQEEAVRALQSTVETGNLPHLIFYGPPGTGKTSLALALCRTIFSPDEFSKRVKELNASDERGIEAIRKYVKDFASVKVTPGTKHPYKIIILDEADSMTSAAQNALRRIIENYSNVTRFIIICNYVSKIIDPILSRCARFRFKQLDRSNIILKLKSILEREGVNVEGDQTYETLVDISGGDLRKAITFAQSASVTGTVNSEILTNISGIPDQEIVSNYFNACISAPWPDIESATIDLVYSGYDLGQVLEQLIELVAASEDVLEIKKPSILMKISEVDGAIINRADPQLQMLSLSSLLMNSRKSQ